MAVIDFTFGAFDVQFNTALNKSRLKPVRSGTRLINEYNERLERAFSKYDAVGLVDPSPFSMKKKVKNPKTFTGEDTIITTIETPIVVKKVEVPEPLEGQVRMKREHKQKIVRRGAQIRTTHIGNLMAFLANCVRSAGIAVEIVGNTRRVAKFSRVHNKTTREFTVATRHHSREFREVDVVRGPLVRRFERILIKHSSRAAVNVNELKQGDSGLLLRHERLTGLYAKHPSGFLIVRGILDGKILDSRIRQSKRNVSQIVHYSGGVAEKFWRGFDRTFREFRPKDTNHICTSDFDVEACGSVAAVVCQTVMPCGKITCKQCATESSLLTVVERQERLNKIFEHNTHFLERGYSQFVNVLSFLTSYKRVLSSINRNYETFTAIHKMIGERQEAPFSHINKINEILIKGNHATSTELEMMTDALFELARYQKNRTENIKAGSLQSFRNKASGKAHLNPALMCDNQLDANGNFVWGLRGKHAKRFFSNYFDEIDPLLGYDKYTIRENPNGARKLAIGNLIVSTNFESLREQLKGEPVQRVAVTQQCVSRRNGNFEYPCCCVTLEDGRPLESDIKMPTKNHLVIGNTGDSKYVDLPTDISTKMYIAKQGYCYINIFLAMLVNVNEADAKDFTKMVRDVIMDRLGKWPSIMDVATACFLLRTFFPDTHNAELPRILVDHTTKTMHVVDSFGSVSTGYHILKANTVNQLILFANNQLESEMKHYIVGGKFEVGKIESDNIKLLARSVYRPQLMKELLSEEPYIILLSVLSPGVLMALYNSGSLERMTQELILQDSNLATIASLLSSLALKVSLADTLTTQINVINAHAGMLLDATRNGPKTLHSRNFAIMTLERIQARNDTEHTLMEIGFTVLSSRTNNQALMEKIYLQELEVSWQDLKWSEKYFAIKESYRWRQRIPNTLHPTSTADFNGRYDTSVKSLLALPLKRARATAHRINSRVQQTISAFTSRIFRGCLLFVNRLIPDIFKFINVLIVMSLFLQITVSMKNLLEQHRRAKQAEEQLRDYEQGTRIVKIYKSLYNKLGEHPTKDEFVEYITAINPGLVEQSLRMIEFEDDVKHQVKRESQANLEKIVAFVSLVLMIFDSERSDCVYRILNKMKGLMGTIEADVYHQSIDDIQDVLEEKKQTVDFEVSVGPKVSSTSVDSTFQEWWANQLEQNNVIPHYRTEGYYMEFTRATTAHVASEIAHTSHADILVRGGVGSGKSTGLPHSLSFKGRVLMIEPTRPLAENVCKQLRGDPFHTNATLRMRGLTTFGSAPITIMTSGFALHYYANNPLQIEDYKFVIFDECHVNDSSAMAFRCLLHEYKFSGKVIKVSATPPGREKEEPTLCRLHVRSEESLSFQQFVTAQGTGSNADVVSHGDNILVYVASYNEVDTLSSMLLDKGHKVTKVDGRTMKIGSVEIATSGTPQKKHFVVATNIIENGVTLDIDVVVDFGLKVVPVLDIDNRLVRYSKVSVSYGERIQRLGRVARFKEGHALRIGHTEKGLVEIPTLVATEAAFLSFAYGLPVMTHNVSTALLSGCTVRQARTMLNFELPHLYMVNLVRFDGSIHPAIHNLLKPYRLRDSEVLLNKMAIPCSDVPNWILAKEYARMGCVTDLERNVRIPFYTRDIPEKLHAAIWDAVTQFKGDAGFGRLRGVSSCKIAYTLQTNIYAVQNTIKIIDELLAKEMEKQAHFRTVIGNNCSSSDFTLSGIAASIRARYSKDHTSENISILQAAKAQLREFENLHSDINFQSIGTSCLANKIQEYGALECVFHESSDAISQHLKLKGQWHGTLITRDVLVLAGILGGGAWMLYAHFKERFCEEVYHQGYNKRQRQKLKFRNAREAKLGREVAGDDGTIEHYFGEAYTKKGKTTGRKHGMGVKSRRFVNMYGYDPADYSFVRFVDPLTGHTIDDSPYTDISLIQEQFSEARLQKLMSGDLEKGHIASNARIEAFYIKDLTKQALKVDLTPHNPLLMCERANTIAGFPEREYELRQTGKPVFVPSNAIPAKNEIPEEDVVEHESESTFRGMRDYNPVASAICCLTNDSDGHNEKLFGLGFGATIVTNQHLFKRNNGSLRIRSKHGEFTIPNTQQIQVLPCKGRDLVVIRLPKDFPPFPQKLKFRAPKSDERICMVGTIFQDKTMTSTVSETSATYARPPGHFWKHWISTKDGFCGLPLVSTTDGSIVGLHSLSNFSHTHQYYTAFPDNFTEDFLTNPDQQKWIRHWKYNADEICWGSLNLRSNPPTGLFKVQKLISDLCETDVYTQSKSDQWVCDALHGNLKAVAACPSQLVTKHVVKGKCVLFETYLQTHSDEKAFFGPLLDAYQKSRLNRDAYLKDILKYATPIEVGSVDCDVFEHALENTIHLLEQLDFGTCSYITDPESIFSALNMKSAVGALYSGKKKDYFRDYTEENKEQIVKDSCYRLYRGWMGLWNGSLKAELRPAEKVQENKTRTFTAAPLDTLLGGKVCVDDFNNRFYSLNLEAPWSVGMTKFYGGWDKLLSQLPDGWVYCDADGSQFDSSLSPYLINAVLQLRMHFMEEWDIGERMLQNLYTEIVYTPISAPDGTVLKKFKGNNSGQPSTVVDNTLMVVLAMQYSLLKLGIRRDDQEGVCRYFVNGDDLLIAVRHDMQHILDTFQESFRTLGLKYDFTSRHVDKTKLWFMSHQGQLVDGLYIPKLEQERIVSILQWDRALEPVHRLEAICAAMIESWGHWELTHHIRKFYQWVLEQAPYSELAREGKAPYIAESALRKLYTNRDPDQEELLRYLEVFNHASLDEPTDEEVYHQSQEELDAGRDRERRQKLQQENPVVTRQPDRDVNVGTSGGNQVPRIKQITAKLALPKVKGKSVINLDHLLTYAPNQVDISNTRSTQSQFETWYEGVKNDYNTDDTGMGVLLNGLMVWCIENGTSPNINGMWVMMDGDEQVEYPIKPLIDHARPTFRQIMAHFSNVAEAYIEKRNHERPYMPRYGLQRNLNDMSLARYAFDFYELTSKAPTRAREAHMQMKAAALRNTSTRMFGLDGNVATKEEDTERHTADDVNRSMHSLNGSRSY